VNVTRNKLLGVLCCSYRQYYSRKVNTIKLYGKMFTSEIGMQQVQCFLRKLLRSHWNTAVIVFLLK